MGLGGMKYAWQRQTKDFGHSQADKYSCLVYDNRGIGDSDKPRARYSTSEMAKDVIELVDHLGWTDKRQLHVIGISMGGMIAQEVVRSSLHICIEYCTASASPTCCCAQDDVLARLGWCSFRSKAHLKLCGTGSKRCPDEQAIPCNLPVYLIPAPLRPTPAQLPRAAVTICGKCCYETRTKDNNENL